MGSRFTKFWSVLGPKSSIFDVSWQSGGPSGSSAKIERKRDPIFQTNLLLWGYFLKLFLIIFWKVLREGIFSHIGPQRLPKGGPMGHFWGSVLVIFWVPLGNWKLSSRCRVSSIFEVPGAPKPGYFWYFFLVLYGDLPQRLPKSFFLRFMSILGAIWAPSGESFLAHFLRVKKNEFLVPTGLLTTPRFCSPGGLKDLLS